MRCAVLMLLLTATASAATYRWVDANGVVHYSDTPQPGAQEIQLPQAQTYRAPPVAAPTSAAPTPPQGAEVTCAITAPGAEQTLFAPQAIDIGVQVQNASQADQVSVNYDGTQLQPSSPQSLSFHISPVDRGTHTVSVIVRDASNKVLCSSAPVTFYVRQTSGLQPNSPLRLPAAVRP
jgi:hypothetical protein